MRRKMKSKCDAPSYDYFLHFCHGMLVILYIECCEFSSTFKITHTHTHTHTHKYTLSIYANSYAHLFRTYTLLPIKIKYK